MASRDKLIGLTECLSLIADDHDQSVEDLIDEYALDSVMPGICTSCKSIHYSCEPDLREGWCDECEQQRVVSLLELVV